MQERSDAERRAIWPCLNVATWRRERSDRAIQQICNLPFQLSLFTFGTQLSAFGKFVKVICLGLNCRGTQLTLFAFGTQFVLGLNLFWDSIVASPKTLMPNPEELKRRRSPNISEGTKHKVAPIMHADKSS